ncbi:MAG: DUF1289 domain-containing protein [Rubripirellula sp.]|nr:DUF1289 domain-containing protein [Rubripirellula sp.]
MDDPSFQPKSPCTGICQLNHAKLCIGCFRSLDEIANWGTSSSVDKEVILTKCATRRDSSDKSNQLHKRRVLSVH